MMTNPKSKTDPINPHNSLYILTFEQCNTTTQPRVGGKNASLGHLLQAKAPVPSGFAVTTDAYQHMLAVHSLEHQIKAILEKFNPHNNIAGEWAISQAIRTLIEQSPMPADVEQAVRTAYEDLCQKSGTQNVPVAIRSSATAEDLPGASFAGQQDTYLWIAGIDNVLRHIGKCWSSLYSTRAIAYRIRKNFLHEKIFMSVGVQKMVNARAAGVMFTLNPINGDRSKVVIDASWGLGEAVVSGRVTPDNYLVDKVALEILKRAISAKRIEYRVNAQTQQVERLEVSPQRQTMPCLSDEEVMALTRYGKMAEQYYGRPQDIEWAIDGDIEPPHNIVLLQSRPETIWSEQRRKSITSSKSAIDNVVDNLMAGFNPTGYPKKEDN